MGISTHVLDTAAGRPGTGVPVTLERQTATGEWSVVATASTDADGRVGDLLPADAVETGRFRLGFDMAAYFSAGGATPFFPRVQIEFEVADAEQHYHVPLLVSPFGYTTYRGS